MTLLQNQIQIDAARNQQKKAWQDFLNNLAHLVSPTQFGATQNQQKNGSQGYLSNQISQLRDQFQVGTAQGHQQNTWQAILHTQRVQPLQGFAPQQTLQAVIAQQQHFAQQQQHVQQQNLVEQLVQQKVNQLDQLAQQQQQQQPAQLEWPNLDPVVQKKFQEMILKMMTPEQLQRVIAQLHLILQRLQMDMAPPDLLYGMNNGGLQVPHMQLQFGVHRAQSIDHQPQVPQLMVQQPMVPQPIAYDFLTAQQKQLHQIQLANAEQQQRHLQNQALEAQMIAEMQIGQQNRPEVNHQMQEFDRPQLTPQSSPSQSPQMRVQTPRQDIQRPEDLENEVVGYVKNEVVDDDQIDGDVEMGVKDDVEVEANPEVLLGEAPEQAPVLDALPELDLGGFVDLQNMPTTSSFAMNFDLLQGIREINLGASSGSSGNVSPGSEAPMNQVFALPLHPAQGFLPFIPQNQQPSVFGKANPNFSRQNINVLHNPLRNITEYRKKKPSKREVFLQMGLNINMIPGKATETFCSEENKTVTAELLYLFKEHFHIYHEFIALVIEVPSGTLSKIYDCGKNRRIQTLSAYHEAILDQHLHALLNFCYQLLFCPGAVPFMVHVGRPTSFRHRYQLDPKCYKSTGQKRSDSFLNQFYSMMDHIKIEVDKIHLSQKYGDGPTTDGPTGDGPTGDVPATDGATGNGPTMNNEGHQMPHMQPQLGAHRPQFIVHQPPVQQMMVQEPMVPQPIFQAPLVQQLIAQLETLQPAIEYDSLLAQQKEASRNPTSKH
ncbi:hypothetical protein L3Y34_011066 [Caenorhabditis briggsae]|uniref:Uncharacterized protein n=1 Tax=Caenorhabditis briggsae TaxID=6238 RepID=A0AAE8ZVG6_CAEBR|nr:hypothetical protein L3Y34_011066 [Caenorhabditis briggsae]